MQRIIRISCSVAEYKSNPETAIQPADLKCPFCRKRHALLRHGYYERQSLLPNDPMCHTIKVARLLCVFQGKTVSLLPDFCLPGRQHGPGILAAFLIAYYLRGVSLVSALKQVRPDTFTHATAQSLQNGFQQQGPQIDHYLSSLVIDKSKPSETKTARHSRESLRVMELIKNHNSPQTAFTHHGRAFCNQCGRSLA